LVVRQESGARSSNDAARAAEASAAAEQAAADAESESEDEGAGADDDDDDDAADGDCVAEMDPELEMLHYALDNITSALGNVAVLLARADAAQLWLASLPMQVDFAEADWTYALLCDQVDAGNALVMGPDGIFAQRVGEVLVAAYGAEALDEGVRARVKDTLQTRLGATLAE
jgi:hypothetical protein